MKIGVVHVNTEEASGPYTELITANLDRAKSEDTEIVHRYVRPTPLYEWPALSRLLGCRFFLKHENHTPTTAFKVRGGIYLVSRLSEDQRRDRVYRVLEEVARHTRRQNGSSARPERNRPPALAPSNAERKL